MSTDEFRMLALSLRESGAMKVRCGDLEVVWGTPLVPAASAQHVVTPAPRTNGEGKRPLRPQSPEERRMMEYRAELVGDES
jgi:hypothetical protein